MSYLRIQIEFADAMADFIQGDINKEMRNSVVEIISDEGAELVFARTKEVTPKKFNIAESMISKMYAEINWFGEFASGNQSASYDGLMQSLIPLLRILHCAHRLILL